MLIFISTGLILAMGAVLYFGLDIGKDGAGFKSLDENTAASSAETRRVTRGIIGKISIPQDFFDEAVLDAFEKYTPIGEPKTKGRSNPFVPASLTTPEELIPVSVEVPVSLEEEILLEPQVAIPAEEE